MAIHRLPDEPSVAGNYRTCIAQVDGPASYANGTGQRIDAQALGMKWIYYLAAGPDSTATNLVAPLIAVNTPVDHVNLLWIVAATLVEVVNAANLSGQSVRIFVIGK